MKSKLDFYIAFYERLALAGFRANVPSYDYDNEYLADICYKGYNIAHLTKTDQIIPNPHAEIPLGAMEQINHIARETAASFTACIEKPYDENIHNELLDGSYKIGEFNEVLLTAQQHPLFGYIFATFDRAKSELFQDDGYTTYYNKNDAMRGFVIKSGLIDERQLFSENELTVIHNNLSNLVMMPDNSLDFETGQEIGAIIVKIEDTVPGVAGIDTSPNLESEADLSEGVEP